MGIRSLTLDTVIQPHSVRDRITACMKEKPGKEAPPADLTTLLRSWRSDAAVEEELFPRVYRELQRLAGSALRKERPHHTLEPSALVHEAYLRLTEQNHIDWRNRDHFFAIAATMMRRILVDHARGRDRVKRGGNVTILPLEDWDGQARPELDTEVLAIDSAIEKLRRLDKSRAKIVELRFFAGLSVAETAAAIGKSTATVTRQWRLARAWLFRELRTR